MSVMDQLKSVAGTDKPYNRAHLPNVENAENTGALGEMMEDHPIPGQSLTQDPEQRLPFETPPEYSTVQPFIDNLFLDITEKGKLDGILDSLRKQVPAEEVARVILSSNFRKGKISTDLLLLSIEPTILMLIALGVHSGIDVQLIPSESDNPKEEADQMSQRYLSAAKSIAERGDTGESINKAELAGLQLSPNVPKNLMQRVAEVTSNGVA